ncbi:hypothetical protein [Micromonospora sp. NPDC023737]|uniref:hypothetical protein n=1 Tax=unclassified Micromonospora TaxID=2617518 RepID=UPI0033C56CDC
MGEVNVRFIGGPAHDLVRALPVGSDGGPPTRWIMRHPRGDEPVGGVAEHLYEREQPDGTGAWTMRYVRTDPLGVSE